MKTREVVVTVGLASPVGVCRGRGGRWANAPIPVVPGGRAGVWASEWAARAGSLSYACQLQVVLFARVPLVYAYSGSSRCGLDGMGWDVRSAQLAME